MVMFDEKDLCCGCGVCAILCPQNAITMTEDAEGFTYPKVDMLKCNGCNLCEKKCAFRKKKSDRSK